MFDVEGVNNETIRLASLHDGVIIAEKMGRGERHPFTTGSYTLARPSAEVPGREAEGADVCNKPP